MKAPGALGWAVLCLALGLGGGGAAADEPLHLTLPAAFEMALRHSPDTAIYRSKLRQAQWQVQQARAPGRPSFEFDASYTRIEPPIVVSLLGNQVDVVTENNYRFGPLLKQAIATFGRLHYGVLAATLNEQSVRNDYRRVTDTLLLQVGTAYDQALAASQNVTIAQANVGLREAHLTDTRKMLQAGTVARYDLIRNESDVNLARQQLIQAQNGYHKAVAVLLTLLGVDPSRAAVLDDVPAPAPPPVDHEAGVQTALQRRPELETLNYAWQAAVATARYQRSQLNPAITMQAGWIDESVTSFTSPNQFSGTLALQVPILDGGMAKAQTNEAMEQAEQLRQQYEETRRSVLLDVENAWDDLQSAWQRLALAEENVSHTEQLAHTAEVRYRGGVGTNLERLDAENTLVQIQSAASSARYDYLQAQVAWQRATGQDYPNEMLDSLLQPPREWATPLPAPVMAPRDADHVTETHPPGHPPVNLPPSPPASVISLPGAPGP